MFIFSLEGYEFFGLKVKEDFWFFDEMFGKGSGWGKNKWRYFVVRRKRIIEKICCVSKYRF